MDNSGIYKDENEALLCKLLRFNDWRSDIVAGNKYSTIG